MRILIVEDEPSIAGAIDAALARDGYAVDVVGDGAEALAWAAAYDYDLAVVDVVLPGLDGRELVRRLRERGDHLPIVMLTALDSVADRIAGL
ncbi:MAG TPA: response regulator, partial [Candidatus Limnocylindrales bacterium]|nr:response regulator [Candidatus Limnocylindrales bacterium]